MNLSSKNWVAGRLDRLPLPTARMGTLWVAFCISQGVFPPAFAQPPVIEPSTSLQSQAVFVNTSTSFAVTASGGGLSYQWRLEGHDLEGETNRTLAISAAQPADEGDYTVVVSNADGTVISEPARLWVVPPSTDLIKNNFTNEAGLRLPYCYILPEQYDPARSYPLVCVFHGSPGDEATFPGSAPGPSLLLFASYGQQAADPAILVWPTRRYGDSSWTDEYVRQVSGLLDKLLADPKRKVDPNRVYVGGGSEGVHAAWDIIGMRPGFFAGAFVGAGWQGSTSASSIKDVPLWAFCAADDAGQLGNTQSLVRALRQAGGNPIYTQYNTGGHGGGIGMGMNTPAIVDWLLAQRLGMPSTAEPLLSITSPTGEGSFTTGAPSLNVSGSAEALGQSVTRVTWENTANYKQGPAHGTNTWTTRSGIPLLADKTNVVIVTATTTSWAPAFGGNTTFNDTLTVVSSPMRATLTSEGPDGVLNWSGGGPPYCVQRAADMVTGDWTDILIDAVPPLTLPLEGKAGFYRVVGQ